jgi:hypothetical protein
MNLQRWQIERIHRTIGPALGYLYRLRQRMEQTLDSNDPLFRLVCQAYDAMHWLSVTCTIGRARAASRARTEPADSVVAACPAPVG